MPGKFNDTTVVIPTYNEAGSIGRLIKLLMGHYQGISIIVCDDGSTDGTLNIVGKTGGRVRLINRKELGRARGLTGSVMDGILAARTRYVVVMDGDMQHPPDMLSKINAMLKSDKFKLVVAVRKQVPEWQLHRRIVSKVLIYLCYVPLAVRGSARCGDIFSGFFGCERGWMSNVIKANRSRYVTEGYKVLYDTLKCMDKHEPIGEVDYVFGTRNEGSSKAGPVHVAALIKSMLK